MVRENAPISAYIDLVDANDSGVRGRLYIEQRYPFKTVTIHGRIYGLKKGFHGFHVHQNGELGNNCKDAGGHFNPFKVLCIILTYIFLKNRQIIDCEFIVLRWFYFFVEKS